MYNKIVVTIVILAMSGVVNAQYYEPHYASPGTFGYANTQYVYDGTSAGFNYFGYMPGPVLYPSRPLADYGFVYTAPGLTPTYGHGFGVGDFAFSGPAAFSPTYGGGLGIGAIALNGPAYFTPSYGTFGGIGSVSLNMQPLYVTPTYGSGPSFGTLSLALAPHQIPNYGTPLEFGSVRYNMASNMYAMPIYATPSRALFNSEFAFGTVDRFY